MPVVTDGGDPAAEQHPDDDEFDPLVGDEDPRAQRSTRTNRIAMRINPTDKPASNTPLASSRRGERRTDGTVRSALLFTCHLHWTR